MTSSRIAILNVSLLSSLGRSIEKHLETLSGYECEAPLLPYELTSDERALIEPFFKTLPEAEQTDGTLKGLVVLSSLKPMLESFSSTIPKSRMGLFFGNTTSGLEKSLVSLESAPKADPETHYLPLDLGLPASTFARYLDIQGPFGVTSTACSAGSRAIITGARLIRAGQIDLAVVGAIDVKNRYTASGFGALGALSDERSRPFLKDRHGLHIGEGGGFLVLVNERFLTTPPKAWLTGWGESSDAHHISAPAPDGQGALKAIESALSMAELSADEIGFVHCHGTATGLNDAMEMAFIDTLWPEKTPLLVSIKGQVGHTLAGAGALGAALLTQCLSQEGPWPVHPQGELDEQAKSMRFHRTPHHREKISHVLVNAFAFGGNNCALILTRA